MSRTKTETTTTTEKKMGVVFYLQNHPQKETIKQLMIKKYKMEVKTENEWNETLAKLLGKKIVS